MNEAPAKRSRDGGSWAASVALLAASLPALAGLATKLVKLAVLRAAPSELVPAMGPELLFAGGWPLAWWALARAPRARWARGMVAALASATSVAMLAFLVVDTGFLLKTGTVLDAFMVRYGWRQRLELWAVLRSELDPFSVVALVLGPLLPALPAASGLWKQLRERLRRLDAQLGPAPLHLGAAVALLGALATAAHHEGGDTYLAALRTSPAWVLVRAVADPVGDEEAEPDQPVDPASYAPRRLRREGPAPERPPNVVLVVLESTRASATTIHDPELETTPFLARLAREGRWARRMYATVPHTSKALVSILCGLTPWLDTPILEAQKGRIPLACLPELLREEGYATAFFQTATATFENRATLVENAGFEEFYEEKDMPKGFHRSSYFGYEDRAMLRPVLRWAREHRERPFLLTVLTLTTHHNYVVPRGFPRRRFAEQRRLNDYLNTVHYLDDFLSRLHRGLQREGLAENTIFVVVGDHGEGFGEHRRYQHDNTIYEEGLHVPFVVAGPGVGKAGQPIEGLRQLTDVMPTVLDLLGYRLEGGRLDGRSALAPPWREFLHASCWYKRYCMARVEDPLKFIFHYHRRPPEVFDLSADPLEAHDLRASGRIPAREVARAVERLQRWRREVNAWWRHAPRRGQSPWITDTPTEPQHPADIVFGGIVRLRGYDDPEPPIETWDRPTVVRYHFEVLKRPPPGTTMFVHVISEDGRLVQNLDHIPVERTYEVEYWKPGEFIVDRHRFGIRRQVRPGRYRLLLGFTNRYRGARLRPEGRGLPIDERLRAVELLRFELPAREPSAKPAPKPAAKRAAGGNP